MLLTPYQSTADGAPPAGAAREGQAGSAGGLHQSEERIGAGKPAVSVDAGGAQRSPDIPPRQSRRVTRVRY